jgi:hypothetical protein
LEALTHTIKREKGNDIHKERESSDGLSDSPNGILLISEEVEDVKGQG